MNPGGRKTENYLQHLEAPNYKHPSYAQTHWVCGLGPQSTVINDQKNTTFFD
jgi:hypothetical protein